jgi:hypothetical protein
MRETACTQAWLLLAMLNQKSTCILLWAAAYACLCNCAMALHETQAVLIATAQLECTGILKEQSNERTQQ